jgi:hypothetical protein
LRNKTLNKFTHTLQKIEKELSRIKMSWNKKITKCQHRVKKIAGKSQLTKILADFLCTCFIY